MTEIEQENSLNDDNKYWHRKQCSNRVFIGRWDIKAPLPREEVVEPEQFVNNDNNSIHSNESDPSQRMLNHQSVTATISTDNDNNKRKDSHETTTNSNKLENVTTPTSDGTSFVTARSRNSRPDSSVYNSSINSSTYPSYLEPADSDEEIDYDLLNNDSNATSTRPLIQPGNDSETESIKTIKANGKLPMNNAISDNLLTASTTAAVVTTTPTIPATKSHKKPKKIRKYNKPKKPLLWKKAGSVFVSSSTRTPTVASTANQHEQQGQEDEEEEEEEFIPNSAPIKREPILCMRSVTDSHGSVPSRYRANKEARFDLLTEEWKQVELVLTKSSVSTYIASNLFWPHQKLEHRVYLKGKKKPKHLELFLLSPLDYTFCLRYLSTLNSPKTPMTITHTFKARSFLKCQEWYMALYNMLSDDCKKMCPKWCEVYIPILELSVNLPLTAIQNINEITMQDIKEAILLVLKDDLKTSEKLELLFEKEEQEELGLCWATKDRAEWIYWQKSSSNADQSIDWVICPQSIEQTHRLELRFIQHTPNQIILGQDFVLKEPAPIEGFLYYISDFFGRLFKKKKILNYFATFDQFLFYIPSSRIDQPDIQCFFDEEEEENLLHKKKRSSFISMISPYTQNNNKELELQEIRRRMNLMAEARGVIDLTEVSFVRRSFSDVLNTEHNNGSSVSQTSQSPVLQQQNKRNSGSSFFSLSRQQQQGRNKPCLELVMENGLHIKFEAYSSETCDLWVKNLAQIIVYWKARREAERESHTHDNFIIKDKDNDSKDGCVHKSKEEELADTRIWSYCLYEQCRDVMKSGVLYYKPHKRGSYTQKMFILTASGWILYYDVQNRNTTKLSCNHERKGALDIAGCYFYSGVDDSKQKKGSSHDRDKRLKEGPRLYENGLVTNDDTLACIFSIWKPKLRRYFSPKRQRLRVYHQDQKPNSKGMTWTFLAKSRREKEEWVCALNLITEHMIRCNTK